MRRRDATSASQRNAARVLCAGYIPPKPGRRYLLHTTSSRHVDAVPHTYTTGRCDTLIGRTSHRASFPALWDKQRPGPSQSASCRAMLLRSLFNKCVIKRRIEVFAAIRHPILSHHPVPQLLRRIRARAQVRRRSYVSSLAHHLEVPSPPRHSHVVSPYSQP